MPTRVKKLKTAMTTRVKKARTTRRPKQATPKLLVVPPPPSDITSLTVVDAASGAAVPPSGICGPVINVTATLTGWLAGGTVSCSVVRMPTSAPVQPPPQPAANNVTFNGIDLAPLAVLGTALCKVKVVYQAPPGSLDHASSSQDINVLFAVIPTPGPA